MNRTFSIEDGFQITMLFLQAFWCDFLKYKMISKKLIHEDFASKMDPEATSEEQRKNTLHEQNWYFFGTVADGTSASYFEKVIEDTLQIPPIKQMGMPVQEDTLFQLMIDFCRFVNKRFAVTMVDSLKFAIDWLEEMRKHPEQHQTEWDLWNKIVIDVTEHGARSGGLF